MGTRVMQKQPTKAMDEQWMQQALLQARMAADLGEVPIGAVVVCRSEVIAKAHNFRETWRDPTAHAELLALQAASRALGSWRLTDCTLYVTLEPCPMCAGAMMLSRLSRVVYGAVDEKGGAVQSKLQLLQPGMWNHDLEITGGVLTDECGMILKDFFRSLRKS